MYIECFIKKADGSPVFVDYEGVRYMFQRNEFGDSVCFVGNQLHVRRLLKMGPECYIEYVVPETADLGASNLGGAPMPLGKHQKIAEHPKPSQDGLTVEVDDSLNAPVGKPVSFDDLSPEDQERLKAQARSAVSESASKINTAMDSKPKPSSKSAPAGWTPEAIEAKVKEFKFLPKKSFKIFVEKNRSHVAVWPDEAKAELAKKIGNLFPDKDPGIKGLNLDDYDRSGSSGDS